MTLFYLPFLFFAEEKKTLFALYCEPLPLVHTLIESCYLENILFELQNRSRARHNKASSSPYLSTFWMISSILIFLSSFYFCESIFPNNTLFLATITTTSSLLLFLLKQFPLSMEINVTVKN